MNIQPITHTIISRYNYNKNRRDFGSVQLCSNYSNADSVSFSGKKNKKFYIRDLRQVPGITCACCGDATVVAGDITSFFNRNIYFPASEALDILKKAGYVGAKHKSYYPISDSKHKAYIICKTLAGIYENEPLSSILARKENMELVRNLDDETKNEIATIEKLTQGLYHDSAYMVEKLKPFEPKMHQTERTVFHILEKASVRTPEKNFTEILSNPKLQGYFLKKLENKQDVVFQNIRKLAQNMPARHRSYVLNAIEQAKYIFDLKDPDVYSKRTTVIELFQRLSEVIPDSDELYKIQMKIHELPSSLNDAGSFIVKYGNYNPNKIADLLISGSIATIEHVIARNGINEYGEEEKGENKTSNYSVLCKKCNNERGRMPYREFEKIHPDMPENQQKQIDIIIENINNGTLYGYDSYPLAISNTLERARKVKKPLDISKLNLLEATKNRGENSYHIAKIIAQLGGKEC